MNRLRLCYKFCSGDYKAKKEISPIGKANFSLEARQAKAGARSCPKQWRP